MSFDEKIVNVLHAERLRGECVEQLANGDTCITCEAGFKSTSGLSQRLTGNLLQTESPVELRRGREKRQMRRKYDLWQ